MCSLGMVLLLLIFCSSSNDILLSMVASQYFQRLASTKDIVEWFQQPGPHTSLVVEMLERTRI